VIVEPLATWIFLALMLVLLAKRLSNSSDGHPRRGQLSSFNPPDPAGDGARVRRGGVLAVLFYVLIVALLAVVSLELARLVVAQLGVGLLPFTYVGVLGALANRLAWASSRLARLVNVAFWVLLAAAMALKTAAEQAE
jgi:hypothetical protein